MWYELAPFKQGYKDGLIQDLEDHLPYKFKYKDNTDIGKWVHKCTHAINERARNEIGGKINCAYCLEDKVFYHDEPNITLKDVADLTPQEFRTETYNYMVQQQRWWNDHPLYIIDELSAYINGTKAYLENDGTPEQTICSCQHAIELMHLLRILNNKLKELQLKGFIIVCQGVIAYQLMHMMHQKWNVKHLLVLHTKDI